MTNLKLSECTRGIADALRSRPELLRVMTGSEIRENIPETPAVQVYFQTKDTTAPGGTDRLSMGGRTAAAIIRQTQLVIHVDVYVKQRANIGDEMSKLEALVDVIDSVLELQGGTPYFGVPGIKAYSYRAERVTFEYNKIDYVGVRFYVTLTIF